MYTEAVQALSEQAATKLAQQRRSLLSHFVRSMMAGMYVGAAIVLIFTVGSFLPPEQLFWRAVLANWLVCLGVWMAARIKEELARIVMIWWCMFTFITCAYEHSIANMCGLMLGLLLPHDGYLITWEGYAYNLGLA